MSKISIIGAGAIGATTAFALLQRGIAREIVINDINQEKALGEVMDLMHGSSLCSPCNSILLVVSNPVDILAYMTYKLSGFPKERVIGSGTVLDTARLRSLLGKYLGIDGRNVQGYVLGEHGDSEFVTWSSLMIGNIPVKSFSEQNLITWDIGTENVIAEDVKNCAYEVIKRKGATAFSVAIALTRITEAIIRDEKSILTVSTLLDNYYGVSDAYLSVPTLLGRNGIEKVLNIHLSKVEERKFIASANLMKEYIDRINTKQNN